DGPAAMGQLHQPLQGRVRWQVTEIPLHLTAFARHGTLAEQPALRSGRDAMMAGGELRTPGGPVHAYGHELFAEDYVVVFPPGDGLPAVLRQRIEHGLCRREWRRSRFLWLPRPRGAAGGTLAGARAGSG